MKSPIPITYIAGAVIFGLICAFGIAAMTHQPLPVQVQINQYAPVKPPVPAIPTIVPVVTSGKPFDPAPPPVVVTTAPLPTITPEPTSVGMCSVGADDVGSMVMTECMVEEMAGVVVVVLPLIVLLSIVGFVFSIFGNLCEGLLNPREPRI